MTSEEVIKQPTMEKKNKKRILDRAFSSYHGRVHISNITTDPDIFGDRKIYINSVCAGHVVVDESDMFDQELSLTGEMDIKE